jgi:(5-formylfuran-3-yl)methyl phosphate synthase
VTDTTTGWRGAGPFEALAGPLMLASVTSVAEAVVADAVGADIIDAKDARAGAMTRLALDEIRAIRTCLPNAVLSATSGDATTDTEAARAAVQAVAATGVDFVKVAVHSGAAGQALIAALGSIAPRSRLVGVLAAEEGIGLDLVAAMGRAGFAGVMLDTFDKAGPPLPELLPPMALARFIAAGHGGGLFVGLAGALRLKHVRPLLALDPDILGFRGGLCRGRVRASALDAEAVAAVRAAIPCVRRQGGLTARALPGDAA